MDSPRREAAPVGTMKVTVTPPRAEVNPMKQAMTWLSRRLGCDRNPLRRRPDRVEAAVVAGLLAGFLIGARSCRSSRAA